jgi:hypothetical protein
MKCKLELLENFRFDQSGGEESNFPISAGAEKLNFHVRLYVPKKAAFFMLTSKNQFCQLIADQKLTFALGCNVIYWKSLI